MEIHPPFPPRPGGAGRIHLVFFGRCERKLFLLLHATDRSCSCWSKIHSPFLRKSPLQRARTTSFRNFRLRALDSIACVDERSLSTRPTKVIDWDGMGGADTYCQNFFFKKIALAPCGNNARSRFVLFPWVLRGEEKHIPGRSFALSSVD